jgi:hypothetical protein
MYDIDFANSDTCANGSDACDNRLCSSKKCQRAQQFKQLLHWLTVSSTALNYDDRISATVDTICTEPVCFDCFLCCAKKMRRIFQYRHLMEPLELIPPIEFDIRKHTVDNVAQTYLAQASKNVQYLIPIKSSGDGNCLFNSIVSLMPDSDVSGSELRGLLVSLHIYIYIYIY